MGRPLGSPNKPTIIDVSLGKLRSKLNDEAQIPVSLKFYKGLFVTDSLKEDENTNIVVEHGAGQK